jgi:foldase protein PrsA
MRVTFRCIFVCGALALVAATAAGCGGSDPGVVRVGGDAIPKTTLNHWMAIDATVDGRPPAGQAASMRRILGFLISSKWLTAEAHELGLSVSEREASKQLGLLEFVQLTHAEYYDTLPREPTLRRLLLSPRVRSPDRLWLMRQGMLATRVEQARLSQAQREVSHTEIRRFYDMHPRQFVMPDESDMEILGNYNRAVVVKARREIESGTPFLTVARRVSIDPEAPNGLQHLVRGREEPPFERVVFAAAPHVLVGPVNYGFYYLFRVLKVIPAHRKPLAQVEAAIRRKLASRRASTRLLAAFERKWIARTNCRSGYVVPKCRQYPSASSRTTPVPVVR